MKAYEELTLSDDFMFGKVMENEELCREVLACVLDRPVGELEDLHPQHEIRNGARIRPIRLDLYTRDDRAIYDAEMQNQNHRSLEKLNLPKRSRYYQATMDVDYMLKQKGRHNLPEGNVIFLCTFDPFGEGQCKYVFENTCKNNAKLQLHDEALKYFINCGAYDSEEEISEGLRSLCRYIMTGEVGSELTKRMDAEVRRIRENEKWRSQYMKEIFYYDDLRDEAWEEGHEAGMSAGREEGIEQGREEGREEERRNTALERQRADALEKEVQELKRLLAMK